MASKLNWQTIAFCSRCQFQFLPTSFLYTIIPLFISLLIISLDIFYWYPSFDKCLSLLLAVQWFLIHFIVWSKIFSYNGNIFIQIFCIYGVMYLSLGIAVAFFCVLLLLLQDDTSNNTTRSELSFVPTTDDDGKSITCRAENPNVNGLYLETMWKLNVVCK